MITTKVTTMNDNIMSITTTMMTVEDWVSGVSKIELRQLVQELVFSYANLFQCFLNN